jgi:hypothetical protein
MVGLEKTCICQLCALSADKLLSLTVTPGTHVDLRELIVWSSVSNVCSVVSD